MDDNLAFDPSTQQLIDKATGARLSVFSNIRVRAEAHSSSDFRYVSLPPETEPKRHGGSCPQPCGIGGRLPCVQADSQDDLPGACLRTGAAPRLLLSLVCLC